jgi:K+-transporting ATPase KdpF subunit
VACWTSSSSPWAWPDSAFASASSFSANGFEGAGIVVDFILGAGVTVGLLVYLVAALLRPERF